MENENSFDVKEQNTDETAFQAPVIDDDSVEIIEEPIEIIEEPIEEPTSYEVNAPIQEPTPQVDLENDAKKREKRKKRRKIFKVLYIIMLVFVGVITLFSTMIGAIWFSMELIGSEEVVDIGEDFELEDLDDDTIVDKDEYFIADEHKYVTHGFDYSDVDYDYYKYDKAECYFEAENFSGVKTVNATCAEDSYIIFTITCDSTAPADDVKVIIASEDEILETYDANQRIIYRAVNNGDRHVFVKIIGDNADVNITVTRKIVGFAENPDL